MLKILYAAGDNLNSKIQLWRFFHVMKDVPCQIKLAAYKKSSPNLNIDWTLDSLLNPNRPQSLSLNNDNVHIYYEQIKFYNPDLIISDLDYFTSYIANQLNITLWQCSSLLINFALTHKSKYNAGLSNQYLNLLKQDSENYQKIINIIHNSNLNLVYSHFGDTSNPPQLKEGFEWIRPYHEIGKEYKPCEHEMVAGLIDNNNKIFSFMKNQKDCVVFSEYPYETHKNITMKSIWNSEDYYCNIYNSKMFVCEGQTSFLADAFYNKKHSLLFTNYNNLECITNSLYSNHLGLSKPYQQDKVLKPIDIKMNDGIQYLHQKIKDL
jgi:hypothetical protein